MSDICIYRIGPLDGAGTCLYIPHSYKRALSVVDATNDEDGIKQIVDQWPDASYSCSPELAEAAERFSLPVEKLDVAVEGIRLWAAIAIAAQPDLDSLTDVPARVVLLNGVSDYVVRDVPARWPKRLAFEAELRGDRQQTFYGALLWQPSPGIGLFDSVALAKQCALLDADEQAAFVSAHDHLKLHFEEPPPYVARLLDDFFGITWMPRPTKREAGSKVLVSNEDALILGGVLAALSLMDDLKETMYSVTETPGRVVRTFVSPAEPWPFVQFPGP